MAQANAAHVVQSAVSVGCAARIATLVRFPLTAESDRHLVDFAHHENGFYKLDYIDVTNHKALLEQLLFATKGLRDEFNQSHFRNGILGVDDAHHGAVSKSESSVPQPAWAHHQSQRISTLWQFTTRAMKRSGNCRCETIQELKVTRAKILEESGLGDGEGQRNDDEVEMLPWPEDLDDDDDGGHHSEMRVALDADENDACSDSSEVVWVSATAGPSGSVTGLACDMKPAAETPEDTTAAGTSPGLACDMKPAAEIPGESAAAGTWDASRCVAVAKADAAQSVACHKEIKHAAMMAKRGPMKRPAANASEEVLEVAPKTTPALKVAPKTKPALKPTPKWKVAPKTKPVVKAKVNTAFISRRLSKKTNPFHEIDAKLCSVHWGSGQAAEIPDESKVAIRTWTERRRDTVDKKLISITYGLDKVIVFTVAHYGLQRCTYIAESFAKMFKNGFTKEQLLKIKDYIRFDK